MPFILSNFCVLALSGKHFKAVFLAEFTLKRPEMGNRTLQLQMNPSDSFLFDS